MVKTFSKKFWDFLRELVLMEYLYLELEIQFLFYYKSKGFKSRRLWICSNCSFNLLVRQFQNSSFPSFENWEDVVGIKVLNLSISKTIWDKSESDLDLNRDYSNFSSNSKYSTLKTPFLGNDTILFREIPIPFWAFFFLKSFSGSSTNSRIGFGSGFFLV